jgi:hypothetical protein
MRKITHWFWFGLLILLSACSGMDSWLATETPPPPTETAVPTPTIVWFPPTTTPTPRALTTPMPTPERRPGLGAIVFSDPFDSESLWDTARSDDGSATLNNGSLVLAVQPGVYLLSLNQDLLVGDFYAEITARASLCRDKDSYGLLFRASRNAYYRYSVICDGTVRLDRLSVQRRTPIQEPLPSGDAPPGAPAEVRLGVWAVGPEMRLFLNGRYQFTVLETTLQSGTLGVFVNSAGETPVTVSFSDLTVQRVDYDAPPPTVTPVPLK